MMAITDGTENPFERIGRVPELVLMQDHGPGETHNLEIALEE